MNKNKVQEEIKRVEEIESMKLKQLSEMDCNLEVTKKCDGCDLWYMMYDTELHKMRWHCVKAEVGKTTGTWERLRAKMSHLLYVDKKLYIKNTYVRKKG